MGSDHLDYQRDAWNRKPGLRAVYRDWFKEINKCMIEGRSIEIGCGIGRIKKYLGGITTVDILKTRWTDVVGDGEILPFKNESVANLILFDVLHHLQHPVLFFREAFRILQYQGRLIVADPYVSLVSRIVYNYFHPEPVNINCNPFQKSVALSSNKPFDSNQAIATLIFYKYIQSWKQHFPQFSLLLRKRYGFLAYPATGGFGGKTLLPFSIISWIQKNEKLLNKFSGLLAFRLLVVLEKDEKHQSMK